MREDWKVVKLGEFAAHEKGKKPKNQKTEKDDVFEYPYVNIEAFEKGIVEHYTDGEKCNFCYENDFLMVWDGSRSGLVGKGMNGALGSTLVRISFPGIENNYAFHYLSSKYQEINTRAKGTGTPHVDPYLLWNYDFPISPLPEQRAIVAKIEELFSDLGKGIADLNKAKDQLVIFRQSVLKKAFEGELTKEWREKQINLPTAEELLEQIKEERERFYNQQLEDWKKAVKDWEENGKKGKKTAKPKLYKTVLGFKEFELKNMDILPNEWYWVKLGNVFQVFVGSTPSRNKIEYWNNGSINWVSSGEVSFKSIFQTKEKITVEGLKNTSTSVHPVGTVMLAMIGEGKTRGQAGILEIEACHNQNTAAIRVSEIGFEPKFLFHYLFLKYEKNRRIGSGNNQKALNQSRIMEFDYPLCSKNEQNQIVKEIESRLSVCDKVEQSIADSLEKAKALRQSILKKAFEGKLLTAAEIEKCKTEKDYEPAAVLLARIEGSRNERIRKEKKKK